MSLSILLLNVHERVEEVVFLQKKLFVKKAKICILIFFFRTTMGENVLEYNGVLFDEDDPYSDRDDDCSLSEDDFLELPFNDRTVCKH